MIELVGKHNLEDVLPLIAEYQAFYRVKNISEDRNRQFFSQFGQHSPLGCQMLFRHLGEAAGFATVYYSYASSITAKVGVLNDLYTKEAYRGQGIAKQLIQYCANYASEQGAARLQWVTAPDNETAQKCYDGLPTQKSEWLFYTLTNEQK